MSEICGVCRGPWPCDCSPNAVPVVLMASADDDYATALARRMRKDPDAPLMVSPYEPDAPLRVELGYGDAFCGHYQSAFEANIDKRIVWCRVCGTILDPYFVLERLASMERRLGERLAAAKELEIREQVRGQERQARALVRRHRYAPVYRKNHVEYCATCGAQRGEAVHT